MPDSAKVSPESFKRSLRRAWPPKFRPCCGSAWRRDGGGVDENLTEEERATGFLDFLEIVFFCATVSFWPKRTLLGTKNCAPVGMDDGPAEAVPITAAAGMASEDAFLRPYRNLGLEFTAEARSFQVL